MIMKPIISPNCRIRYPKHFLVGEYSIIDDYSYFSTKTKIGRFCHIAACCTISGGKDRLFVLGDYSGIGTGARVFCMTDDFINDMVNIVPSELRQIKKEITGDVTMENMTGIGANSVVMPSNHIPEGTVVGALSFVPPNFKFKPWSVYFGIPIKFLMYRNKESVMKQVEELEKKIKSRDNYE